MEVDHLGGKDCITMVEQLKEDGRAMLTFANVTKINSEFRMNKAQKSPTHMLSWAGHMCLVRALMYAMLCGKNGNEVTEAEFLAGCNRFGIDNPMPTQTKRLYLYGNTEDMDKLIDNLFKKHNEPPFLNPELFGSVQPDKNKVP